MKKKALILMPTVPFPPLGADEQNRIGCIRLFQELGFEVAIIAKTKKATSVAAYEAAYGVSLVTVPYRVQSQKTLLYFLSRLTNPFRWDGAADEYFDSAMEIEVQKHIAAQRPAFVFVEYSFLWPLARLCKAVGVPVFMRSHNFEPLHFLSEDGVTLVNLFKFLSKLLTEYMSCAVSDIVFALTPREARQFNQLLCPKRKIRVLHSGMLPYLLEKRHTPKERKPVTLLFMGSRYTIPHNLRAATFLIQSVIPAIEKTYPGVFEWNITGGKLPEDIASSFPASARYLGYVDNLEALFSSVDAVVSPRIAGHGMQLKVFEPLCRGIPVITSESVLGGYSFVGGKDILFAESVDDFVHAVGRLRTLDSRRKLGDNAWKRSSELFNETLTINVIKDALLKAHIV